MKTLRNFGYFNLLVGFPLFYYSFFIGFLWLLPAGLIFVGLGWAYRHRPFLSPGRQAALGLFPALSTSLFVVGAMAWGNRPLRQTVLVPAGYRGLVVIGYDVSHGQPKVWDEGGRLIRVSPQGTAATQFMLAEEGVISGKNDKVYAVTATGKRQRLYEFNAFFLPAPPPTTLGVYHVYTNAGPDLIVCVIARADSISHYIDTASYTLRPAYIRQVKSIADTLLTIHRSFPR